MMTVQRRRSTTLLYSAHVLRTRFLCTTAANVFDPASRMRSMYHSVFLPDTKGFQARRVCESPQLTAIVAAQAAIGALSMREKTRFALEIWVRASASEQKSGGPTMTTRAHGMWSRIRCRATSAPMEWPTIVLGLKSLQWRTTRSTMQRRSSPWRSTAMHATPSVSAASMSGSQSSFLAPMPPSRTVWFPVPPFRSIGKLGHILLAAFCPTGAPRAAP